MLKKKIISTVATFLVLALALALLLANHDTLVIWYGIRPYTTMRTILSVTAAIALIRVVLSIVRTRERKPPEDSQPAADVPEKGKLTESNRTGIYDELTGFAKGKWKQVTAIQMLLGQLDSMNEYQEKMAQLLKQNDYLDDKPSEIVQRIEDCMYVNLQKLINYMRIVQTKDLATMASKTDECVEKNKGLLDKTDDFVIHLVDYINDDMARGEEEKTKDYVDSYMFVVLNAIDLPETYLK